MLIRIRRNLTYANVMATVAVFIALGGSAYAAAKITGRNVKNGSLTGRDVKNNSLTGKDVKRLGPADFKRGALPKGPPGSPGPAGPAGPGAKRFFVDTGVNLKDGVVFKNVDFEVFVACTPKKIEIVRQAPANVAVNGAYVYGAKNSSSPTTQTVSRFLDGGTGGGVNHELVTIAFGGQGSATGTATVQSYLPGSDTRHEYTVVGTIADEPGNNCAAYGSVIPAS